MDDNVFTHSFVNKIKKTSFNNLIELEKTSDILKVLGENKKESQILVGFALETEDGIHNATTKMKSKNLDYIILNSLKDKGAGFSLDTNKITIISNKNNLTRFDFNHWIMFESIKNLVSKYKINKSILTYENIAWENMYISAIIIL